MSGDRRLERVYAKLKIGPRARLTAEDFTASREPDRVLARTTPVEDQVELYRRVCLLGSLNLHYGWLVAVWEERLRSLRMELGWLVTLHAWGETAREAALYLELHDPEQITASEHERRLAELRSERLSIGDAAECLLERDEIAGGEELRGAARRAAIRELKAEVTRLLDEGVLEGDGSGRRRRVTMGSLMDWRGHPLEALPEWGLRVEVVADGDAGRVAARRRARERCNAELRHAAGPRGLGAEPVVTPGQGQAAALGDEMAEDFRRGLAELWQDLKAAEAVAGEMTGEFDGADPLMEELRAILTASMDGVEALQELAAEVVGLVELGELDRERLDALRGLVAADAEAAHRSPR